VVVAPNYVGYAASNADYHLDYQLKAQASDAIDALLAARASATQIQLPAASTLFFAGYSQGGAVALATQRALERPDAPPALKVRAVAASAGATMLGDMARTVFAGQPSVGASGFLPLLLTSYQRSYVGLYANPAEVYAPPFGATSGTPGAMPSIPGTLTYPQLLAQGQLPLNLFDRQDGKPFLVHTAFRQAFKTNPQHPLRRAFEANNLDGFKPLAPLLMCHGAKDPLVTVANTDTVAGAYASKGSTVSRVDLEDTTLPLARAFQAALDTAAASTPRAAAYHFVGMPFCQVQAWAFFEQQMPR
jgi:predicted esterase